MSKATLDLISNRIRYESIAKLAGEVATANSFADIKLALQRHCKFVTSAYQFIFGFFIENQVVEFCFPHSNELIKNFLSRSLEIASEIPTNFHAQNETFQDEVAKLCLNDKKVQHLVRLCKKGTENSYLVYFASKEKEYNHIDTKFLKLIVDLVFPKVISILLTEKIQFQHKDLKKAYRNIDHINKELTSSINYAKRIQQALLPSKQLIKDGLKDSFILFKPRDVVSGDFYYSFQAKNKQVVVAADCTGHGVPGAMLSIFCIQLFREVCRKVESLKPDEILNEIDKRFNEYLLDGVSENEQVSMQDGMDVSVSTIDYTKKILFYSAASRPLIYLTNQEVVQIKGSRFPIGSPSAFRSKEFELNEIKYKSGDRFFMFSDGLTDQFGGPRGKKLTTKRFISLLEDSIQESIHEQGEYITHELDFWKEGVPQIDDILLIGFEL